jgi:hypothetical protein
VENQNYDGLAHRRAVIFFNKSFFIFIDEALGDTEGLLDLNFQLAPGNAELDKQNLEAKTLFDEGYNLSIKAHETENLRLNPMEGQVSFIYTQKEPRPAFSFQKEWKGDRQSRRFLTSLIPFEGKVSPEIRVEISKKTKLGDKKVTLLIDYEGKKETITYTLNQ